MTHELITPDHLARQAIIYVRQSTPHQVLSNLESRRLQLALQQRARECGWDEANIEVIDEGGITASTKEGRHGFNTIAARVTLGQVGILFAYDVSRMSRNCSDWYPLLDLCGCRRCLIGDRDGIYDPATPNGRLLLGLKGQLSEWELHTLRGRLTAGLLSKAERGELALTLPVGLVRDELQRVFKDCNREVQDRLTLIFQAFLRLKSIAQVVRHFHEQQLLVPRSDRYGDITWRAASLANVSTILKNPAYAGAFVYGRTRQQRPHPGQPAQQKRLPMAEWRICLRDKYPAYIDWDTFTRIQAMIRDNHSEYERNQNRGVPRAGKALLHGITYCGVCGHKMVVQYKRGARYLCNYLRQHHRAPLCQSLPADFIDLHVVKLFFEALSPAELEAYERALTQLCQSQEEIAHAHQQQLERFRHQARLAERQFQKADPDNRLVTAELEKRWEQALRELNKAENAWPGDKQQTPASKLTAAARRLFLEAADKLPDLWEQGMLNSARKKALLRSLIDKVVMQRLTPDTVRVRIVWKGSEVTQSDIPVSVGSLAQLSFGPAMEKLILQLARQGKTDAQIAAELAERGYRSPRRQQMLPSTVRKVRLRHRQLHRPCASNPRRVRGHIAIPEIARRLKVPCHWIYGRIRNGTIEVAMDPRRKVYLFPDRKKTWTLFRQLLAGKVAKITF